MRLANPGTIMYFIGPEIRCTSESLSSITTISAPQMKISLLALSFIILVACRHDVSHRSQYRNFIGKTAITTKKLKIKHADSVPSYHVRPNVLIDDEWPDFDGDTLLNLPAGSTFRITNAVEKFGREANYGLVLFCELENPHLEFEYEITDGRLTYSGRPWILTN
jgi:hypothetical protein